jgi:hypothetical protein
LAPAQAQVNAGGIALQTFKNVSGAPADDFHAVFGVPTIGLGQDVDTATKYPFATGLPATQNFSLAPPVGNNRNFQVAYAPGLSPIDAGNNLKSGTFTLQGANVATRTVGLFESFTDLFSLNTSVQFHNEETSSVVLASVTATSNIPIAFFNFEEFASAGAIAAGTPVNIAETLTLPGLSTTEFPFGPIPPGTYGLVTGLASLSGDTNLFPFASAVVGVPEPGVFLLLAAGLAALLFRRLSANRMSARH